MQTLKVVRTGRISDVTTSYTAPEKVFHLLNKAMSGLDRECFMVLHLDSKKHIICKETVSIGSLDQSVVHPREVFKAACINGSAGLILAHNHPSGDPRPSQEDIAITERLRACGQLLGIEVIDHIIVGDGSYFSFTDHEARERWAKVELEFAKKEARKAARKAASASSAEAN
jgi:DNA repair protein RadC